MPFSTFFELKNEIIDYTHRGDLDLKIPDFITLAEKEMFNNPVEQLQIKYLEKTTTIPTTTISSFIDLPADYKSMRSSRLSISNERGYIQYRVPQQLIRYDTSDRPCFYTIIANQIEFDRIPDEVFNVEIQYRAETPGLTADAPTNLLLTNHPEIYLYGSLYKALIFAQDVETAIAYKSLFYEAITGANKSDKAGAYGPAPVISVEGPKP